MQFRSFLVPLVFSLIVFGCGDDDVTPDAALDGDSTPDSDTTTDGDIMPDGDTRPDATVLEPGDPGCGLESAAFCETFDSASAGGQGGDVDETRWAVSRWGNLGARIGHRGNFARLTSSSSGSFMPPSADTPSLCGTDFSDIPVGQDFVVCGGQLEEVLRDDGNAFTINSMMVRQQFDFTDRTGTITFDVDAKREHGHGWWIEMWVSEEPQPVPYQLAPTVHSLPKNAIGVMWHGDAHEEDESCTGVNAVFRTQDFDIRTWDNKFWEPESTQVLGLDCVNTADTVLNRFEIKLSQNRIEIFGSDAGRPETLRTIGHVDNIDLNFERGFVSFQHAHYNAAKPDGDDPGNTPVQVYRWDNLGFDGPVHAPLRSFDAPMTTSMSDDEGDTVVQFGYELPATVSIEGVEIADAQQAILNLSVSGDDDFEYRVNGGEWTTHAGTLDSGSLTSWSLPVALEDLQDGTNTIEVRSDEADKIGNIDISLVD